MARPVLRRGSENRSAIRDLQRMLKAQGADIAVDGVFGSETRRALTAFQKKAGLDIDGVAGKQTWNALSDMITPKPMAKPVQPGNGDFSAVLAPGEEAAFRTWAGQNSPPMEGQLEQRMNNPGSQIVPDTFEPDPVASDGPTVMPASVPAPDSGLAAALAGMDYPRSEDMDAMQDRFRYSAAPPSGPPIDMTAGGNSPLAAGGVEEFNPDAEGKFGLFALPVQEDRNLNDVLEYDAMLQRPGGKLALLLKMLESLPSSGGR